VQESIGKFRAIGVEIIRFNNIMINGRFLEEKLGFRKIKG